MGSTYTFKIFTKTEDLPNNWDDFATANIFLTKKYLAVLEHSAPINMSCFFIGIFDSSSLVGTVLSQFLESEKLTSFGDRDQCMKTTIRNFSFKNFASSVLFIGNNMLTGQNAFSFTKEIDLKNALKTLYLAIDFLKKELKSKGKRVHIITIKDFSATEIKIVQQEYKEYYPFSTQPNMVFEISKDWTKEQDYIDALSKKYRDQYKRARKKITDIEKRKLDLNQIIALEDAIYNLYFHVAKNAPFNTFFLAKNHFRIFKEYLKDDFLFYGYFLEGKLIGFNTLIKNGAVMDTYFLGYDDVIQKEKMLYLNMLYDMIAYSIKKGFREIVFARTALEIKSSVGAKPVEMFGLIKHNTSIINKNMSNFFNYFEPKTIWQERNPFK